MDLKKIFVGGEPRISNPDLMYTQYSNYYAIHGIERGLNVDGNGVVVDGCVVSATYSQVDEVITINLTDGYLGIGDRLVKAESTPSIVNFDVVFSEATTGVYVYGEVDVTFNPLGDKTFNDASFRQTWEQSRISLFANQTGTPVSGAVIIAYITIVRNTGSITITKRAKNIGQQIIADNNAVTINTTRNNIIDKVVTPDNLFDVMGGNYYIKKFRSTSRETSANGVKFVFTVPSTISEVNVMSARATSTEDSRFIIGSAPYRDGDSITANSGWYFIYTGSAENTFTVFFDAPVGTQAEAVCICSDSYNNV